MGEKLGRAGVLALLGLSACNAGELVTSMFEDDPEVEPQPAPDDDGGRPVVGVIYGSPEMMGGPKQPELDPPVRAPDLEKPAAIYGSPDMMDGPSGPPSPADPPPSDTDRPRRRDGR